MGLLCAAPPCRSEGSWSVHAHGPLSLCLTDRQGVGSGAGHTMPEQQRVDGRLQATIISPFHSQVEALLASEDYGKDLASVNNLLKKHQLLEADISAHEVSRVAPRQGSGPLYMQK